MSPVQPKTPLAFFGLIAVMSVPFLALSGLSGIQLMPGLPIAALMSFVPAAAALFLVNRATGLAGAKALLARIFDGGRIHSPGLWLLIISIIPIRALIVFNLQRWSGAAVPAPRIELLPAVGMLAVFLVAAAGEELGWSGYATAPMVTRWGRLGGAVGLGLIWAAWHWIPLAQVGRSLAWICWWTVGTVSMRVIIVWLFNRTGGSVAAAIIVHALSNLAWQLYPIRGSFFDPRIDGLTTAAIAVVLVASLGLGRTSPSPPP